MLITAAQILPSMLPSKANGNTIAATVKRPTIHPKNTRGRGVITDSRWASPVAAKCQHEGRHGVIDGEGIGDRKQRRLDELHVQQVAADQTTPTCRDQCCDDRGREPTAPQPRCVDHDPLAGNRFRDVSAVDNPILLSHGRPGQPSTGVTTDPGVPSRTRATPCPAAPAKFPRARVPPAR